MKKPQKTSAASAKKKPIKTSVKAAKKVTKAKVSPVLGKGLKRPSGAKKVTRKVAAKGVLADLKPILPADIKIFNSHSVLFERFYDNPNYYLAYGAFYMLHAIYSLKLHRRPIPFEAIKVLEDAIEDISQQKTAFLINDWEVDPKEARKIVDSSHRAWLLHFSKKVWGTMNPEEDFLNERTRERAMVVSSKHDGNQLAEFFKRCLVGKSESNIKDFSERTNRAIQESTTGFEALIADRNNWTEKLVWFWGVPPLGDVSGKWPKKIPPVCLWSSDAITKLFVDRACQPSEGAVATAIHRLGLNRPRSPVPTYGVSSWQKKITFVPRSRGRFDS